MRLWSRFRCKAVAATTITFLMVALVAAEARQVVGVTLARWKMPPHPAASRCIFHRIIRSRGCWLGQPDPRVGSKMPPRRSLAPPCGSQTFFGAASPLNCRPGTMQGMDIFGGPRPQSSTTPMVASPVVWLISGLSGPDSGEAGDRFSSQTATFRLLILLQPVLARRK